jgi:hypothetical protein
VKVRRPSELTDVRARQSKKEIIDDFFNKLKSSYDQYHFLPQSIYNLDETGPHPMHITCFMHMSPQLSTVIMCMCVCIAILIPIYDCICICNVGFDGLGTPRKVVTVGTTKAVKVVSHNYGDHCSMLAIVNAVGDSLPPLFVFKAKQMFNGNVLENAPPHSACTVQPSGYFTSKMTLAVVQHFERHAVKERPLLLLLDGAKVHIELDALKW